MYKLFFLLALIAFVAVYAGEYEKEDLSEAESAAFAYYRPYWGARFYGRYGYGYPYYRTLGFPRYYSGLYL